MTLDPKVQALLDIRSAGGQLDVCEYLAVEWNNGANTKYYGTDAYSQITPFRDVRNYTGGEHIQAKILGSGFQKFEISGDIRTDAIAVTFEDADGAIAALYKLYGPPRIELFRFYPAKDYRRSVWWGQMIKTGSKRRFVFTAQCKNGSRGKERMLPSSPMPSECRFVPTFGGKLDTLDKVATSGCPYSIHLEGGTLGNLNPDTGEPYIDCPGTRLACGKRLGTSDSDDRYFGGTDLFALATQTDNVSGNMARTKGNATIRNKAVPWGFGTKWWGGAEIVLWAREFNTSHPDEGFVRGLWRCPEGPIVGISGIEVNQFAVGAEHINIRLGERGQPPTSYPGTTQRLSSTSVVFARRGPVNPATITQGVMTLRALFQLYSNVAVFTDDDPETFTRVWSDDLIWCLIEMYTNQKAGLQFEHARFNLTKALAASAACTTKKVTMTVTKADGETITAAGRRATFDAVLEMRAADQQILDICRAGRISPPFQDNGKYSIEVLKAFTSDQITNAVVFRDYGNDKNIVFDEERQEESVIFNEIPDDQLPNELTCTFDEANNYDIGRPITVNDPDQQRLASKLAGNQTFNPVPKQLAGLGVRNEHQAIRLAYHNLFFGDFESGGTKNNATAAIPVPFEWTFAIERYGCVKLDLRNARVPTNPTTGTPFEYFRVMKIEATENNEALIHVAAYNKEFYEVLEVESELEVGDGDGAPCASTADCPPGYWCDLITHRCLPADEPGGCDPDVGTVSYDSEKSLVILAPPIC